MIAITAAPAPANALAPLFTVAGVRGISAPEPLMAYCEMVPSVAFGT